MIKHVYLGHMVLQLDVTNTLNDQLLENARIELELPEGWELVSYTIVFIFIMILYVMVKNIILILKYQFLSPFI